MKLLRELTEEVETLIEGAAGERPNYFIQGPFLQADIKNRNGRVYPLSVLQTEVARYTKELIKEHRALGELGYPDSPTINLPLVSHKIVELNQSGKDFHGKAKVLTDTPNGKIVKALIDEKVKLGVSSRGVGSLEQRPEGNMVGEDFYLSTAADIVADPSAPAAFVRGIMEGKEWVRNGGVLTEAQVESFRQQVAAAPRKKSGERQIVEARAFEDFLRAIRVQILTDRPFWGK